MLGASINPLALSVGHYHLVFSKENIKEVDEEHPTFETKYPHEWREALVAEVKEVMKYRLEPKHADKPAAAPGADNPDMVSLDLLVESEMSEFDEMNTEVAGQGRTAGAWSKESTKRFWGSHQLHCVLQKH